MRFFYLTMLVALTAQAESLYVRPNGGSYGLENGSNWDNAFDGFGDVAWGSGAGQLGNGDTLYAGAGDYTVGLDNGGQSGWTLAVAQDTHVGLVKIQTGTTFAVNLRGYDNINIYGRGPSGETNLVFLDNLLPSGTIGDYCLDPAVSYCRFTNAVFSAPWTTRIKQTNNVYFLGAGTGEDFNFSNNGSNNGDAYDQAWVVNCQFFVPCAPTGGDSPDGAQPGHGTTFIGCLFKATVGANSSAEHQDLIQVFGNNYLRVIGCEFVDSADSLFGGDLGEADAGHIRIYNSIFRRTLDGIGGNAMMRFYTSQQAEFDSLTDIVVQGNTFADGSASSYGSAFLIQKGNVGTTTSSCVFQNNIIFNCGNSQNAFGIETGYPQTGWAFSYNLVNAGPSGDVDLSGWVQSNGQTGNPEFVTYTEFSNANDYQLQSDSPCIDNGTTGTLAYDFDGVSRPQGSAWDIGAFEYVSSGPNFTSQISIGDKMTNGVSRALMH